MNKKNIWALVITTIILAFSSSIFGLSNNEAQLNLTFNPQSINITSPISITYSFEDNNTAAIYLNATSHFPLTNWNYILTNLKRNTISSGSIPTSNNYLVSKQINVNSGQNKLEIFGTDVNSQIHTNYIYFTVVLPNNAPIIENISEQLFVCENTALSYFFSSYDIDEDTIYVDISPKSPFYVAPFSRVGTTALVSEIYSGILRKSRIGEYQETISINDGNLSDSKNINITVIEVNNAPLIENVGVQTIWTLGEGTEFNKTIVINDAENGQDSSNFNLSISFEGKALFNISPNGEMYLEAKQEDLGVHNITICAEDNELENIHPNISICSQNGSAIKTCLNFSLTVTNENRPPTITNYWPQNQEINISGTSTTYFNITKYDPDSTIPDSYWYLDNQLIKYSSGTLEDSTSYAFPCGIRGNHEIEVIITDGILNDSFNWNLNVYNNDCPTKVIIDSGGGGGGGGGGCISKIACEEWHTCQNAQKSLTLGIISRENYRDISSFCQEKGYDENTCGFQIRSCIDFAGCLKNISNSLLVGGCFFTINPSCSDRIQNCHDDKCEILIDCGGPCSPCATCSDGIQNQNENGIDCDGPCPVDCKLEIKTITQMPPFVNKIITIIFKKQTGIFLIILIIILFIIYRIRRIYLIKKEKRRIVYRYFRNKNE